jgi:glutamyl-tRNA reductase
LQNLSALRPGKLIICNRDLGKAAELAQKFNGSAAPLGNLPEHLIAADIVVSSTANPQPIITAGQFAGVMKRRKFKPVFLIDIALPRDIEPAVGRIENVYLYNLDDLQKVVSATRTLRQGAIDAATHIVNAHVEQFALWNRTRELGPAIDRLYRKYHALAEEELQRTFNKLPGISEAEKEHLRELTRRIVNKLLHDPIQTLRQTDNTHAPTAQYLHALQMLFKLDDPPVPSPGTPASD